MNTLGHAQCGQLAGEEYTPAQKEKPKEDMSHVEVLRGCKNTEVESKTNEYADKILSFCETLSLIILVLYIISGIAILFYAFAAESYGYIFPALLAWAVGTIFYYVIGYIGKSIWSVIKLLATISATCKRIESRKKDSPKTEC